MIKHKDAVVIKITNNLVDVFTGDDWYNWSRMRRIKGRWVPVRGHKLPDDFMEGWDGA